MKFFDKLAILIYILGVFSMSCCAFELDMSVDEDIRKNYNPSKLESEALPDLPKTLKSNDKYEVKKSLSTVEQVSSPAVPKTNLDTDFSSDIPMNRVSKTSPTGEIYNEIKIGRGTKFKVKSQTKVSDWNTAGAGMTFVSTAPTTKRYISFPTGTVFKGVVEESHQPNFAGNGGLLKLKANTIILNGNSHDINAKVVKANDKFIYFNNIKGKRGYWRGVAKNVNKGQQFYNKTRKASSNLASNPIGTIISPIPTIVGAVGYGVNFIASPVTALWAKGDHITLPAGTNYTIKLREDFYMYK